MLSLQKKQLIGTFADGSLVYDYGSKFFAITDSGELVEKIINIKGENPFAIMDIVCCDRYEYLEDVLYTHRDDYTVSAVLDMDNIYIKGHKIDFELDTIDDIKYLYYSTIDYFDYLDCDPNNEEYKTILKVCKVFFNDENIDDLSVLDEDYRYYSFVIINNEVSVFVSDEEEEMLNSFSLNDDEIDFESRELAEYALKAVERLEFDAVSLLNFDEIEQREILSIIKIINSFKLEDLKLKDIATVLKMNYKSLSASKDKEKYLKLYKQELISKLLEE